MQDPWGKQVVMHGITWRILLQYTITMLLAKRAHIDADVEPAEDICKDSKFYLDKSAVKTFYHRTNACPPGYELAALRDHESFSHAAIFLFGCLGPSNEAWISSYTGTVYAVGDPLIMAAPDAIEKGGPILPPQIMESRMNASTRRSKSKRAGYIPPRPTIHEKSVSPLLRMEPKIRTVATVDLDSPESAHPFLCQLILIPA